MSLQKAFFWISFFCAATPAWAADCRPTAAAIARANVVVQVNGVTTGAFERVEIKGNQVRLINGTFWQTHAISDWIRPRYDYSTYDLMISLNSPEGLTQFEAVRAKLGGLMGTLDAADSTCWRLDRLTLKAETIVPVR